MVGPPDGSGGTVFLAFHVNCPNRYLSEESINIARQGSGSYPAYVLGRIIMIEQHVATEVGFISSPLRGTRAGWGRFFILLSK